MLVITEDIEQCTIDELLDTNFVKDELKSWVRKAGMLGILNEFEFSINRDLKYIGLLKYKGKQRKLILPPVDILNEECFRANKFITEITLHKETKIICERVFLHCYNLRKIDMSNSTVCVLPRQCFYECWELEDLRLPNTLKVIESEVFLFNKKLKNIILPEGLEVINDNVIGYNHVIESITIPKSVRYMGCRVISYCNNLKQIIILSETLNKESLSGNELLGGYLSSLRAIYINKNIKRVLKERMILNVYYDLIKVIK